MIDPCFASSMDALVVDDMQSSVRQGTIAQLIEEVADAVSKTFGNQDGLSYCGPRIIELTTDPSLYSSFLTFDQSTNELAVQTDDDNDIGVHMIVARISL